MSKRAKLFLSFLCLGLLWGLDRTGASRHIDLVEVDQLVLPGIVVAAVLFYAHTSIFPPNLEKARRSEVNLPRTALAIGWALFVTALLVHTGDLALDGFLFFALAPMSIPIALLAPRGFRRSSWLVLYGLLGLYVFTGSRAADAKIAFRAIAAVVHAMLISAGAFYVTRALGASSTHRLAEGGETSNVRPPEWPPSS
jgi:hypothetical protein